MELEIRQLRVFLAVARSGSFSRAATLLGLTQPAVTAQVQRLERHFGADLFTRTTRHVTLTEAGRNLVILADRAVLALGEVERAMAGGTRDFRLSTEAPVFIRILGQLRQLFPALDFDMAMDLSEVSVAQIRTGQRHAAQVYDFEAAPLALDGLRWAVLLREHSWVVLPRSHRLAAAERVSLGDLADDPWVLRPPGQRLRSMVLEACRNAGFEPQVRHAATDSAAIEHMIAEDGCVTLGSPINQGSPYWVHRPLAEPVERVLKVVWQPGRVSSELIDAIILLMRERYRDAAARGNPEYAATLPEPPDAVPSDG